MAFPFDFLQWIIRARYMASGVSLADGETSEAQCDAAGAIKVAVTSGTITASEPAAALNAQTTTLVSSGVIKASAGSLVMITGWNESLEDRYLVLCNATAAPVDTTATTSSSFKIFKVPGGASFSFSPPRPLAFSTGISWVFSSTRATLTRSPDAYLVAQYL